MTKNENGFSLIEVMVAVSIMAVITLAFAEMVSAQHRQIKSTSEKMAIQDVKTRLKSAIQNSAFCDCLFAGRTFDLTALPITLSAPITLIPTNYQIPPAAPCTAGGTFLQEGTSFENTSVKVNMNGISLKNIVATIPGSSVYRADLEVTFDSSKLVTPLQPVSTEVIFNIDLFAGAANARNFLGCGAAPPVNKLQIMPAPINVVCNETPLGAPCPATVGPVVPAGAWLTVNLPAAVPLTAKAVLLRVVSGEVSIYMRPTGSGLAADASTMTMFVPDNGSAAIETWVDVTTTPGQFDIFITPSDPLNSLIVVSVVGYST